MPRWWGQGLLPFMATSVMRAVPFRRVVVLAAVVVRPVVRVSGGVHFAFAHGNRWRPGALMVAEVHTVVRHVAAVMLAAGAVRLVERFDAERFAVHWAAPFAHAMTLARGAALSADLVAWRVRAIFRHFPLSFRAALDIEGDRDRLLLGLIGGHLPPDILGYCLTRRRLHKWHIKGALR
jgi:hypothetical protein